MSFDLIMCIAVAMLGSLYVLFQEWEYWRDDDNDDFGGM